MEPGLLPLISVGSVRARYAEVDFKSSEEKCISHTVASNKNWLQLSCSLSGPNQTSDMVNYCEPGCFHSFFNSTQALLSGTYSIVMMWL